MRITTFAVPFALVSTLAFACGGTTAAVADSHDAGSDSPIFVGDDVGDDEACVDPVEGAACTSTGEACPQIGDACCIGYIWQCDTSTHKWVKEGLGCACVQHPDASADVAVDSPRNDGGPWTCGSTVCTGAQYCEDHPPGIVLADGGVPDDAYDCSPLPQQCATNPTCACVRAAVGNNGNCMVTSCDESNGHVELHCIGI
jgi:hypothetical protein